MPSIPTLGTASGLPLQKTLEDLRKAEEKRLVRIDAQKTTVNARISAYGQLKSAVEALRSAATSLADSKNINGVKLSTTGSSVNVIANPDALPGQYHITVHTLATPQSLQAAVVADRSAQIGSGGTIRLTMQSGATVEIAVGADSSLNGIATKINTTPGSGVRASIINDGSTGSHLILTAKDTGTNAKVNKVEVDGNASLSDILAFNCMDVSASKMTQKEAVDATLTLNDIAVTSSSNTLSTTIDNLTLTLTSTGESSIKVSSDLSGASKAVSALVTAYNGLQTSIVSLKAFTMSPETKKMVPGIAATEMEFLSVQTALADTLHYRADNGTLRTLTQIGISLDAKTGNLNLDKAILENALANDPNGVAALLSGDSGWASKIVTTSTRVLGDKGPIASRMQNLSRSINELQKQYNTMTDRINQTMKKYEEQFARMDVYVKKMNSLSAYLKQQATSWANSRK